MEEPHLSASGAQQGAISHASLNPPQSTLLRLSESLLCCEVVALWLQHHLLSVLY